MGDHRAVIRNPLYWEGATVGLAFSAFVTGDVGLWGSAAATFVVYFVLRRRA